MNCWIGSVKRVFQQKSHFGDFLPSSTPSIRIRMTLYSNPPSPSLRNTFLHWIFSVINILLMVYVSHLTRFRLRDETSFFNLLKLKISLHTLIRRRKKFMTPPFPKAFHNLKTTLKRNKYNNLFETKSLHDPKFSTLSQFSANTFTTTALSAIPRTDRTPSITHQTLVTRTKHKVLSYL